MTGSGVVVGAVAGFALARLASSYFSAIRTPDVVSVVGAVLVLLAASIVASAVPAARAACVEVMEAMRTE